MGDVIDSVSRNLERLIRWAYPGILFVTLLALGNDAVFDQWQQYDDRIAIMAMAAISSSFVIYGLQRYFIGDLLVIPIAHAAGLSAYASRPRFRWFLDPLSNSIQRRFGVKDGVRDEEAFSNYLMSRWAAIHATGLTSWVFALTYLTSLKDAPLRWISGEAAWVIVGLLVVAYLSGALILERMELDYFQRGQHPNYLT